ncbi:MAG: ASKHA domain-containing protein, partial [Planctomycetota bacterium]
VAMLQDDIDNVITAKAAVFAAARIVLARIDLEPSDVDRLFVAGGFGNYINLRNAIAIGLFPDLPLSDIAYVGNTSIWGAKLAALSSEARDALREITSRTTCYDLLGSTDYVEQFERAMFLPHTDLQLFPSLRGRASTRQEVN